MDESLIYEPNCEESLIGCGFDAMDVPLSEQSINKTQGSESSFTEVQADEPTTSTNSSNERKRKRQDDRFFQLIRDEPDMMQKYLVKSLDNEEKVVKLLEENNALLSALINK
ncbi:uncharacterized protein LOC126766630 [Bactrocera neohumeralis]|uniref:uncharacterized protein LOC126766630 n=1 Tax=Bactrocera neohumeralis TaxID=98809 RepID=UPI00216529E1|nr:uncharacterized protein LOC126766630 [Bactrocera neohumeralis]